MRWPTLFLTLIVSLILTSPVAYAQEKWVKLTLSLDAAEKIRAIERDVISYSRLPGLMVLIGSGARLKLTASM